MFFFGPSTDLKPAEFADQIKTQGGVVIDCRTPLETSGGTWPGAKCIDWNAGAMESAWKTLDPAQPHYLYCRSGARSGAAANFLKSKGFKQVYNLGGYDSIARLA